MRNFFKNELNKVVTWNKNPTIPIKCCMCQVQLPQAQVEAFLTPDEAKVYYEISISTGLILAEDEVYLSCPSCTTYGYITDRHGDRTLFFCLAEGCKRTSCGVCQLKIDVANEKDVARHVEGCARFGALHSRVSDAIENACKVML